MGEMVKVNYLEVSPRMLILAYGIFFAAIQSLTLVRIFFNASDLVFSNTKQDSDMQNDYYPH